jgi:hypothetical protein
MYEIIKVGIPLQTKDITDDFIKIIEEIKNSKDSIGITTVDYWPGEVAIAPAGNSFLLNNLEFKKYSNILQFNCINTMGVLWGDSIRDISSFVEKMIDIFNEFYKSTQIKRVYIFAGGSPLCGDAFTLCLRKIRNDLKIVDTKSCIDVALRYLDLPSDYEDVDYVIKIRENDYFIDVTKVNVLLCVQKWYEENNKHTLKIFFEKIKKYYNPDDCLYTLNIKSDTCDVLTQTVEEAERSMEYIYTDLRALIMILHKKDLK